MNQDFLSNESQKLLFEWLWAWKEGTELIKNKERLIVVLVCNADGTDILRARYIGSATNPGWSRTRI